MDLPCGLRGLGTAADGPGAAVLFTVRQKADKSQQAVGQIHSDFERGFIRASVAKYDELAACGYSMANVKAKGLQRTEGKEYVVQDVYKRQGLYPVSQ